VHRVKGENKNEKLKTVAGVHTHTHTHTQDNLKEKTGVGNIYSKSDVNKIGLYLSKHENCLFN